MQGATSVIISKQLVGLIVKMWRSYRSILIIA